MKRTRLIVACILILSCLSACGKSDNEPVSDMPTFSLDTYVDSASHIERPDGPIDSSEDVSSSISTQGTLVNPYHYLTDITLRSDEVEVSTYIINSHVEKDYSHATGEKYGISSEVEVLKYDDSFLQSIVEENKKALQQSVSVSEIKDQIEEDVAAISYIVLKSDGEYPCAVYYRTQKIASSMLVYRIAVDNTVSSDKSNDVLEEVLDAAGIDL